MEIEEAVQALRLAQAAVEKAGIPESWRESWGREILPYLLNSGQARPFQPSGPTAAAPASSSANSGRSLLATRVGVPESALADVFDVADDSVALHVASTRISATKSKATREIALLIAAARQGAGIDDSWTDITHVRDALTRYNRYDQSNFAKYLRDTEDVFNLRGKPVQQLRLTRPGWEAAEALIRSLTGTA